MKKVCHFRGPRASASLKRKDGTLWLNLGDSFPRPTGLGLIEADLSFLTLKNPVKHFRGPRASASLKPRGAPIRGPAMVAISEAHGPRPH